MQVFNMKYMDDEQLTSYIYAKNIQANQHILIQIFTSNANPQYFISLSKKVKTLLPHAVIIGCTTDGEILHGEMMENTTIISFSIFEKTIIKSLYFTFDDALSLSEIHKKLYDADTKALIVLSDGFQSDTELFIKELHKINPDVVIAGGRAADYADLAKTYVFTDMHYTDNGCVLVSLSSKELFVNSEYLLNWTPIGKEMLVTKCDGNILYELNHQPVMELYKQYLGNNIVQNFLKACQAFPLTTYKDNVLLARAPVRILPNGAMLYAGHFEKGENFRFSFANLEDLTDNLRESFDNYAVYPSEAIYVFSCISRKNLLGNKLVNELNLLESLAPSVGFFTYGEFFQSNRMSELLNVTTTFMMLSESKRIPQRTFAQKSTNHDDMIKRTLTHLIKKTTQELEYLSTHDTLTGLYSRSEYQNILKSKIQSAQKYGEQFGLILLDIDYFKLINDNYGHDIGDEILKSFADTLKMSVNEDDFVSRWGGEEFIIIANGVDRHGLEHLTKKLQMNIAKMDISPVESVTVSFGLTTYHDGDTDMLMFKRVDNALYTAKQSGRNKYIIS